MPLYLEELELERERCRLRPGDLERERRRTGDRRLGDRDLLMCDQKMLCLYASELCNRMSIFRTSMIICIHLFYFFLFLHY